MCKNSENDLKPLSVQALKRMPLYLAYLTNIKTNGEIYISAAAVAKELELNEVQVRKDLAYVCKSRGIPKKGFVIKDLTDGISEYLGYNNVNDAIVVGVGKLGRALMDYSGFSKYGLNIIAGFDCNKNVINNKDVFDMDKLKSLCARLKIKIAVITTPAVYAQQVCDELIDAGILAIWNFAPVYLKTPRSILVQNENMASDLALLSNYLRKKINTNGGETV